MARKSGEWLTVTVESYWISMNATGQKALVLQTQESGPIAFVLPDEGLQKLASDLAKLAAMPVPVPETKQ